MFVHARNATVRTATVMREMAQQKNHLGLFVPDESSDYGLAQRAMSKSRNKQLIELFQCGLAIHHAGMLRSDRMLVEKYFADGFIRVLVCTATLAWGVNLPAHAVSKIFIHPVTITPDLLIFSLIICRLGYHQRNRNLQFETGKLRRHWHIGCPTNIWTSRSSSI